MLKAVISKPACPPLPLLTSIAKTSGSPVFLESSSNVDNNTDLVTTKVLAHQPFFQNPHTQKIQTLEAELRSILESGISTSQKALLYQSALNQILEADKRRKMKPTQTGGPILRGVRRRGTPQGGLPQPLLQHTPPYLQGSPFVPVLGPEGLFTPARKQRRISSAGNPRRTRPYTQKNRVKTATVRKKLELGVYPEVGAQVSPRKLRSQHTKKPELSKRKERRVFDEDDKEDLWS